MFIFRFQVFSRFRNHMLSTMGLNVRCVWILQPEIKIGNLPLYQIPLIPVCSIKKCIGFLVTGKFFFIVIPG
jgi:hypothetical protein